MSKVTNDEIREGQSCKDYLTPLTDTFISRDAAAGIEVWYEVENSTDAEDDTLIANFVPIEISSDVKISIIHNDKKENTLQFGFLDKMKQPRYAYPSAGILVLCSAIWGLIATSGAALPFITLPGYIAYRAFKRQLSLNREVKNLAESRPQTDVPFELSNGDIKIYKNVKNRIWKNGYLTGLKKLRDI